MGTYEIEKKVKLYIEKYQMIAPGDSVLLGVSGGADSVCLLLILHSLCEKMKCRLQVLHVNHQVRKEAKQDALYVENLCEELEIPFYLEEVDMLGFAKQESLTEEEAGRILRYRLFREYKDKLGCRCIAVAHHQNDRAETMLFNLFRGTGIQGLSSIKPVREDVIRPILCLSRTEIESYLQELGRDYCEDSTNASDEYSRNKIRHHIVAYAQEEICDQSILHMNETAEQLLEIQQYLEKATALAYDACVRKEAGASTEEIDISLPKFTEYDPVIQKRLLLFCLEQMTPYRKDITAAHIQGIRKLLGSGGSLRVDLPYHLEAVKQYERLILRKKTENERERDESFLIIEKPENEAPKMEEYDIEKQDSCDGRTSADTLSNGTVLPLPGGARMFFQLVADEEEVQKIRDNISNNLYTKCIDYDKIASAVTVRTRRTGDYIICDSKLHRKSIKEYMINEKIPKDERDCKWLVADGDHVIWLPGYRISEYYKIDENTKCILKMQIQEEDNA